MRKTSESSLKEVIEKLLDTYRLRDKLNEITIGQAWSNIMGKAVAKRTSGITIKNGVLFIHISSASLRQELFYQREKILDMMNREIGGNYLREVIID